MDDEQAAEILDYLLQAAREPDETRAAADQLADQDRRRCFKAAAKSAYPVGSA
jgi:hypothetical protein